MACSLSTLSGINTSIGRSEKCCRWPSSDQCPGFGYPKTVDVRFLICPPAFSLSAAKVQFAGYGVFYALTPFGDLTEIIMGIDMHELEETGNLYETDSTKWRELFHGSELLENVIQDICRAHTEAAAGVVGALRQPLCGGVGQRMPFMAGSR